MQPMGLYLNQLAGIEWERGHFLATCSHYFPGQPSQEGGNIRQDVEAVLTLKPSHSPLVGLSLSSLQLYRQEVQIWKQEEVWLPDAIQKREAAKEKGGTKAVHTCGCCLDSVLLGELSLVSLPLVTLLVPVPESKHSLRNWVYTKFCKSRTSMVKNSCTGCTMYRWFLCSLEGGEVSQVFILYL